MRSHLRFVVKDRAGNVLQNAAVFVYQPGTTVDVDQMFSAKTAGDELDNPLISNAQGEVEAWLETAQSVDLRVTDNGATAYYPSDPTTTKSWVEFVEAGEVYPSPEDISSGGGAHPNLATHDGMGLATDAEVAAVASAAASDLANHVGDAADAHSASAITNTPAGTIAATNVQTAINELDGDVVAVDTALDNHIAAADPHTVYQKESEKGAANGYASLGADGLVPQDQLGTGTQDGTKYLRDDGTWQVVSGGVDTDDQTAAEVPFTPTGAIAANNVQSALAEVDSEKIAKSTIDAKGDLLVGTADDTVARKAVGSNGTFLKANSGQTEGVEWAALADADIPAAIARDSEVTSAISTHEAAGDPHTGYMLESAHTLAAHDTLGLATQTELDATKERALTMGKAGTISATDADAADFLLVVPFAMTLKRIKCSRKTHGSAASVVQIRRSTDNGASFSNAFGTATFGSSSLVATGDPADLAVSEGDVLNFSVSTGGGTNLLVELVATV